MGATLSAPVPDCPVVRPKSEEEPVWYLMVLVFSGLAVLAMAAGGVWFIASRAKKGRRADRGW